MSQSENQPRVTRRTVTLDHDKVVKEVATGSDVRIIRTQREQKEQKEQKEQSEIQYQDPFLGTIQTHSIIPTPIIPPAFLPSSTGVLRELSTVLVINASQSLAQEITVELSRTLPGATILFAPTLHLALWILQRRSIDIILSSSALPDGPLAELHDFLELMSPPPELVVLSDLTTTRSEIGSHPGYRFVELRRISSRQQQHQHAAQLHLLKPAAHERISDLGADIRNDLNNPLQEIVAMAFVAHASQGLSPSAEQALSAIQRAAANMARVVNKLEDKIRSVVSVR